MKTTSQSILLPTQNLSGHVDESFYDREWTERWQDMKVHSPVARHTRRLIQKALEKLSFDSLLDIGCGEGSLLSELGPLNDGASLVGMDFSAEALRLARPRIEGDFYHVDIEKAHLDKSFDVGVCSEVLEHLLDDEGALRNIACMCRYLIVTVPSGPLRASSRAMGHVRHYTKADLASKLKLAGYRVLQLRAWGFPLHDPLYACIRGSAPEGATTGRYGSLRKVLSKVLYGLFFLNVFDRGHKLIAVCERQPAAVWIPSP